MTEPYDVVAVNLAEGRVLTAGNDSLPIGRFLDASGDECDQADAVMVIAGRDCTWVWVDLRDFEGTVQ